MVFRLNILTSAITQKPSQVTGNNIWQRFAGSKASNLVHVKFNNSMLILHTLPAYAARKTDVQLNLKAL